MARFFRTETGLFIGLWLLLMIGGRSKFLLDPGTFWHTVVGEQILTTRGFFETDDFTYTHAGSTWIPHQWLGECAMALIHRIGAFDSLLLLAATTLAVLYTLIGMRLLRAGLHPVFVVVLLVLALAASSGHFHIRPHLATIVGFALTTALLLDVDSRRAPLARLSWLVPLFWLWANTHGGMLGGLATLGLTLAGWTLFWLTDRDSPLRSARDIVWGGLAWTACAAVACLNPYGVRLPLTWLQIYGSAVLPEMIKEHARLNLGQTDGIMVLLLGMLYLGLLVTIRRGPRFTWFLPLVWLALAFDRVRHAPLFAVAALLGLAEFFPLTAWARSMQAKGSDLYTPPDPARPRRTPWNAWLLPALLVAAALCLQTAGVRVPVLGLGTARLDPTVWPIELLPALREHEKPGTPIFNEYNLGGFLIYHAPGYKVFLDDRCELYDDRWLKKYDDVKSMDPHGVREVMGAWQEEYPFAYALTIPGSNFDLYFESTPSVWERIASSPAANLYRRTQVPG
jgi:hypothetical protein